MSSSILNNNRSPTLEFANDMSITALQHDHHSKSGPAIAPADAATEREQLIAANQAFAATLKRAFRAELKRVRACWRQLVRSAERTALWLCSAFDAGVTEENTSWGTVASWLSSRD